MGSKYKGIHIRTNEDYARLLELEKMGCDISSPEFTAGYLYGHSLIKGFITESKISAKETVRICKN